VVELGLGYANRLLGVLIGKSRIENFVAMMDEESRFDAAWTRLPAVEEQDFHGGNLSLTA
jgi:hypothetical protein